MNATTTMTVANTILAQLGGRRFTVMTGARDYLDCGDSLRFRLPANIGNRVYNQVEIKLDADDTYTMTFRKVGRSPYFEIKKEHAVSGLYCDQLCEIFTNYTAIYTSL